MGEVYTTVLSHTLPHIKWIIMLTRHVYLPCRPFEMEIEPAVAWVMHISWHNSLTRGCFCDNKPPDICGRETVHWSWSAEAVTSSFYSSAADRSDWQAGKKHSTKHPPIRDIIISALFLEIHPHKWAWLTHVFFFLVNMYPFLLD